MDIVSCMINGKHHSVVFASVKTMNVIKKTLRNLIKPVAKVLILVVAMLSIVTTANAQSLSPQKMAAVMAVVDYLLLSDREKPIPQPPGTRFEMEKGDRIGGTTRVTAGQPIFFEFPLQDEGVEFCLNVFVNPIHYVIEINGKAVTTTQGRDNCFQIPEHQQRLINYVSIRVLHPTLELRLYGIGLESSNPVHLGLPRTTRGTWNERAVRKVLKIFAFGGHATDGQIQDWADMDALKAIRQMLTFDEHNLKLSPLTEGEPYADSASIDGTLWKWAEFLSDASTNHPTPERLRPRFAVNGFSVSDTFSRLATVRGFNPFRQRIAYWETNYHMAVNRNAGVLYPQVIYHYDKIMKAHEDRLPYHEVMGVAAKSAAIAMQYGHERNLWVFDRNLDEYVLRGNDDFGREIHQLFYGIFGVDDPNHENGTIRATSKMLTDMQRKPDPDADHDYKVLVNFGTSRHHTDPLQILGRAITGANASEKIDNLMPISIAHPESLKNLPIMIIEGLAADNLNEGQKQLLRASWASMAVGQKDFLAFIHAYAISDLLHNNQHVKYLTSLERALYLANKNNIDNIEAYAAGENYGGFRAGRTVRSITQDENAGLVFHPLHNVFGAQTAQEAADSSLVFKNNFEKQTKDEANYARNLVNCADCYEGMGWEKSWPSVLPDRNGKYYVKDIAPWLWNHAVGSMDYYTELERAHLYALLGTARIQAGNKEDGNRVLDLNMVACVIADYQVRENATNVPIIDILNNDDGTWGRYCNKNDDGGGYQPHEVAALDSGLTGSDIENNAVMQSVLAELGEQELRFSETQGYNNGENVRKYARQRVNSALGFIFTTPFVFAEGK